MRLSIPLPVRHRPLPAAHTRVVNYYSATYGCDADRAPQKIVADHIDIVKLANRQADATRSLPGIYQSHPIVDVVETVRTTRSPDSQSIASAHELDDLQVPIALDPSKHEQILSVEAELVRYRQDPRHRSSRREEDRSLWYCAFSLALKGQEEVCWGWNVLPDELSFLVHFKIRSEVPVPE